MNDGWHSRYSLIRELGQKRRHLARDGDWTGDAQLETGVLFLEGTDNDDDEFAELAVKVATRFVEVLRL